MFKKTSRRHVSTTTGRPERGTTRVSSKPLLKSLNAHLLLTRVDGIGLPIHSEGVPQETSLSIFTN